MATKLGTLTLDLVAKIGNYTAPLSKAEQQTKATTQRISADMSKGASAIDMLGNSANRTTQILGSLVATAGIGFSVSELIKYSDTYTGLNNRLKLVTTSETQLATAVKDTFEIAQKSRSSWETTAAIYQRFAQNSDRLGLSQERVASITETVSKAVAISGASTESANAAMMQFGQALASGVLRGEEFNSVNEQTPAVLDAIAKGLGVQRAALKSMAEEGKLTTDVLIKALEKADQSVQDLFGKTDVTIGQSFTYLNNEITKFVGESGKGSGAATALSSSVMVLANNLDLLTNAAMVGGAYLAGSYISSLVATTVASAKNTLATAANTAATKTKILADYELAKAELAASAAMVRSMGATNAETAALVANSRAAYQKAAASKAAMLSSASLLGVLGGPVGLGLTVAGVAASYLLMQDNAEEVNKKLAEQASVADKAASELSKLQGVDRKSAINDLTAAFEAQNKELKNSGFAVSAALIDIQNYEKGNWKVIDVINQANKGTISYSAAIEQLNGMKISPDLYNALKKQVEQYDSNFEKANKSATALGVFGKEVVLTGNAAQNAALQHKQQNDALNETATAADKAKDALTKYRDKLKESAISGLYKQGLFEQGYSPSQANAIFELQQARGMSAILSKEEVESALNVLRITEQTTKAEQAYNDRIKQNSEALKKTANEAKRRREEQERLEKEQTQTRDQVSYEYVDDFTRMNIDYQKQVAEINKANFGSEQSKYLEAAKARYDFNAEMYLRQITSEINQHKWSEEEKLKYSLETEKEVIENSGKYNKELKELKLKALGEVTTQELAWLELEKQQRLLDARQFYMTDAEYMQERYKLERDEIAKNMQLSKQERDARIAMLHAEEEFEKRKNLKSASIAWGQSYADMTGTGAQFQIEQDRFTQYDQSNALFEAQIALANSAAEREAIWQAHNDRMAMIDEQYWRGTAQLNLSYGEQITSSFADMAKNMYGEQSSAYKAMFAASKAFAIAQSLVSISQGIAMASANPFPYNLAAMATVAASTAGLVSNIQSVAGVFHGGTDYVPKESSYLLDKGERVLSPRQNSDLTRYLNERQSSNGDGVNININVPSGYTANESRDGNGNVTIDVVRREIADSWNNLSRANSSESRSMQQNFSVARNR